MEKSFESSLVQASSLGIKEGKHSSNHPTERENSVHLLANSAQVSHIVIFTHKMSNKNFIFLKLLSHAMN